MAVNRSNVVNNAVSFKDLEVRLIPYRKNADGSREAIQVGYLDQLTGSLAQTEDISDVDAIDIGHEVVGFSDDPRAAVQWSQLQVTENRRVSADGRFSVSFLNSDRPGMLTFSLIYESQSLDFIYGAMTEMWNGVGNDGKFNHVYWNAITKNIKTERIQQGFDGTMQVFDGFPSYGAQSVGDLTFVIIFPKIKMDSTPVQGR